MRLKMPRIKRYSLLLCFILFISLKLNATKKIPELKSSVTFMRGGSAFELEEVKNWEDSIFKKHKKNEAKESIRKKKVRKKRRKRAHKLRSRKKIRKEIFPKKKPLENSLIEASIQRPEIRPKAAKKRSTKVDPVEKIEIETKKVEIKKPEKNNIYGKREAQNEKSKRARRLRKVRTRALSR